MAASQKIKKDTLLRIKQLENELAQTREDMRSITEEQETANEELQKGNEGLLSSEELQTLNEELETSKEELQTTNEELTIINHELLDKQEQLNASRRYAESIVTTLREPLIILDKSLRVKTANASFYKQFKAEQVHTEGELFYEIQNRQWDDIKMRTLLEKILPKHERLSEYEVTLKFPLVGERHLLLNAQQIVNDRTAEQLILLAIEDVTERKLNEQALTKISLELAAKNKLIQASEKRFKNIFTQSILSFGIFKGAEMIVTFANEPLLKIWQKGPEIIGKPLLDVMPELKTQQVLKQLNDVFTTGIPFSSNENRAVLINKGKPEEHFFSVVYQPYFEVDDVITGVTVIGVEVTDYVMAKKQIEASEKFNRSVIDSSPDCLQILTKEGRIHYMNSKGIHQMEIDDFTKIKNKYWWNLWGTENKKLVKAEVNKVLKGETTLFSVFCLTAKGTPKWWDVLLSPVSLTDEGVQQIIAISRDVTERKTAEKLLQESETKFRTLSETIPNMVWVSTPDGKKIFFNKHFLDYTGMSIEELKNDNMRKIIFPGDLKKDLQQWKHSLKTGEDFNMEKRIRHHDGTYRWHICHSSAQKDAQGNITGWIGSNTEIEEQKKFAEKLESKVKERTEQLQLQNQTFDLAENVAKLGSYRWNLTENVMDYSDNLFRLFDCEPQEFVPSFEKFLTFIHPDDLEEVIKNGKQTMRTGKLVESPYRIISKTKKIKHFRSSGNFSSEGVNKLLIGTIQDVSKDIQASENLNTANINLKKSVEELKQTNQQLEQFANAASHDLQEPLRKIITFSKRLQDRHKDSLPEEVKTYLDKIQSASARMTTLIKDLLNYSFLLDNEKLFSKVNLNDTLTNILNDFELRIVERKAIVKSDTLPTIDAIPLQMNQLFYNLISNALKFTKDNVTPLIIISSRTLSYQEIKNYPSLANKNQVEEHRSYVEIIFKDNGIGFEQQYDKQIFTIFQRLHDNGTYIGTGIGLALCKKIIENHQGEIFVKAEENKGAEFHIILPIN